MTTLILILLALQIRSPSFITFAVAAFFAMGVLFGLNDRTVSDRHVALMGPQGSMALEGVVVSAPETTTKGKRQTVSFVLEAHHFYRHSFVYQTEGKVQVFLYNPGREIHFGDRLRIRGTLEDPKTSRNPYTFDYAGYLAAQGIFKVFRGIGHFSVIRQEKGHANPFLVAINRLRTHLKGRIETLLPARHSSIANALLLGFRKEIPHSVRDDYIRSGTAHVLAISGLNISLIGGLFYFAANFFRVPRSLRLIMTVLVILSYTALAGVQSPVLRAGIMGVVILVGFLFGQDRNIKSAFSFAFLIMLISDPSVLFQASFQLSFVAIASLIFLLPKLQDIMNTNRIEENENGPLETFLIRHPEAAVQSEAEGSRSGFFGLRPQNDGRALVGRFKATMVRASYRVRQVILASLAVTIGLFPLLIWYFHLFSVIGLVANLIVVPIAVWGIAATFILLAIDSVWSTLAMLLAFIPSALFEIELRLIKWFANIPLGYFFIPAPRPYFFLIYYGWLAAWMIPARVYSWFFKDESGYRIFRQIRRALMVGLGLTSMVLLVGAPLQTSRLVIFDLGKTDAAFMSFSNGVSCFINTGRHFPSDQGYWVLRPFLMARGVRQLDHIVLTQVDAAHAGGFKTLLAHIPLKHVWLPGGSPSRKGGQEKYVNVAGHRDVNVQMVSEGDVIQLGSTPQTSIKVLAADRGKVLALLLEDADTRVLYLSSPGAKTFERLSELKGFEADVVFLSHHEDKVSEEEKGVLKQLKPRYVISNQRDRIPEFKAVFQMSLSSEILFIADLGAVEFERANGKWNLVKHPSLGSAKRTLDRIRPA